jgi:dolichyl-phosphate beta-glucosyltransferase
VKLSVVIPAYNEELRLPRTLEAVSGYLSGKYDYEIMVVDDGSIDGTVEICREFFKKNPCGRVLENKQNRGKGYSVRRGMLEADGEFILFSDADMSAPIIEIEKLVRAVEGGADIAVGSRGLSGSDVRVHQPFPREAMGKCFNLLVRLAAVRGIKDTQCGFKLFRRGCAREIFKRCRVDGFSFDVEALFLGRMSGCRIEEIPVVWVNSPASRVNALRDPFRMLRDVFLIRFLFLAGGYKS